MLRRHNNHEATIESSDNFHKSILKIIGDKYGLNLIGFAFLLSVCLSASIFTLSPGLLLKATGRIGLVLTGVFPVTRLILSLPYQLAFLLLSSYFLTTNRSDTFPLAFQPPQHYTAISILPVPFPFFLFDTDCITLSGV